MILEYTLIFLLNGVPTGATTFATQAQCNAAMKANTVCVSDEHFDNMTARRTTLDGERWVTLRLNSVELLKYPL